MAPEKEKRRNTRSAKPARGKKNDEATPETKTGPVHHADHRTNTWKAHAQLILVVGFVVFALVFSQVIKRTDAPAGVANVQKPLLVQTVEVVPGTQTVSFEKTGTVKVRAYVNIVPQVSGKVVEVSPALRNGGVFEKDAPLFVVEQADYKNRLDMAQAEVESARTALALAEAESEAAQEEWNSLHPKKDIPDLVARLPQLEQAKAALKAAEAQLADARLAYERTVYSLPYAGRVVQSELEVGQVVTAGQSYGQVYPERSLEIVVPVQDKVLRWLMAETGNSAVIKARYLGKDITLRGKIARIGGTLDEETRFVDLVIEPVGEGWQKLVPGVFVDVALKGVALENVWLLPNQVLQGQNNVWVVNEDMSLSSYAPEIVSVGEETTLAIGSGKTVELVEGLLKNASEGMIVRVVREKNPDGQHEEQGAGE